MYSLNLLERTSSLGERRWKICHGHANRARLLRQPWNRDSLLSLDEVRRFYFPEEGLTLADSASLCPAAILATTSQDEKHDLTKTCPSFNMGIFLFCLGLLVPRLDMTLIKAALATV